jgi:hypothetical protein
MSKIDTSTLEDIRLHATMLIAQTGAIELALETQDETSYQASKGLLDYHMAQLTGIGYSI